MSTNANPQSERPGAADSQPPSRVAPPAGLPADVAEYIGERPIVTGESPQEYDALFGKIASFVVPADPVEWIWVKDIVDALWEARRFRRMRNQILELGRPRAMKLVLETLLQDKRLDHGFKEHIAELVSAWMEAGAEGEASMAEFLSRYGLEPSAIMAETFLNRSQVYDQLERLAAAADKRRDAVLREIERRRAGRAQRFQDAANIVDAESEDVPRKSRQLSAESIDDKRSAANG